MRGAVRANIQLGKDSSSQLLHIGRLEGLDLLPGTNRPTSSGVAIDCAARTIRIGTNSIRFGRAMAVNSGDLVQLVKTVRVCHEAFHVCALLHQGTQLIGVGGSRRGHHQVLGVNSS